jgi:uncharacterized protein
METNNNNMKKPITFFLALTVLVLLCRLPVVFGDDSKEAPEEVLGPKAMEMINAFTAKDFKKVCEMNLPLAKNGDQFAQWNVGNCYLKGKGVEQDYKQAFKWYSLSAKQGHKRAQFDLGVMYDNGEGIPTNYKEAFKWFLLSAEQGYPRAQRVLAGMYENGRGVKKNHKEAIKWHRLSAEQGHEKAQINLDSASQKNSQGDKENVKDAINSKDIETTIKLLVPLAEEGSVEAKEKLNELYGYKLGAKPNENIKTLKWLRLAVDRGYAPAMLSLGSRYFWGFGVPRDKKEAVKWFLMAANQGDAEAQDQLGNTYWLGIDVPKNYKEAAKWYQLAAEQGVSNSQWALGDMYESGNGVLKNYKEAIKWYQLAAEQGVGLASRSLGNIYEYGEGVPQNYKEAVKWHLLATEQGVSRSKDSIYDLAGKNVPQALKVLTDNAKNGSAKAQYRLSGMYLFGSGVPEDHEEAFKLVLSASEQGNADAQYQLGFMYERGMGVSKDYVLAHMWSNLGRSQGAKLASSLDKLEKKMTPSQIEKAQEMARNWLSKVQKEEVSSVITSKEKVISNNRYLIGCDNNAEYYDKESKKKTLEAEVSAAITIDADQQKASLSVVSTNDNLIGVRSNDTLSLTIELDEGENVYSGIEKTGDPKSKIYFSYYAVKKMLLASYADVVIKFNKCVDLGGLSSADILKNTEGIDRTTTNK